MVHPELGLKGPEIRDHMGDVKANLNNCRGKIVVSSITVAYWIVQNSKNVVDCQSANDSIDRNVSQEKNLRRIET